MLNQEELQKRITCAALLPEPGPEVLKEVCRSHLEALARLDEAARRTAQPGRSNLVDNLTLGQIISILNKQEFKVDNEYPVPVFAFSSLDHPGCTLHAPVGVRLDAVVVRALQISRKVTDSMVNVSQQEKLRVDISGTLHGITDSRNRRDDPFDITILAYSPVDNRDYILVIQGCSVTHTTVQQSNAVAEFTAQKILRWTADLVATHDAE